MKPAALAILGLSFLMFLAAIWFTSFWWQFALTGLIFFVVAAIVGGNDEKEERNGTVRRGLAADEEGLE